VRAPETIRSRSAQSAGQVDSQIQRFPDVLQIDRIDVDFPGMPEARWLAPNPDNRFDALTGVVRLNALEASFSNPNKGWGDSPSAGAVDWISQPANTLSLLGDLESVDDKGAAFPQVWGQFGWVHSPAISPNVVALGSSMSLLSHLADGSSSTGS
jgi:hypothetical protein